jgi:hypothetical protein
LSPRIRGEFVVVIDEEGEDEDLLDELAAFLSQEFQTPVTAFSNHDDSIIMCGTVPDRDLASPGDRAIISVHKRWLRFGIELKPFVSSNAAILNWCVDPGVSRPRSALYRLSRWEFGENVHDQFFAD